MALDTETVIERRRMRRRVSFWRFAAILFAVLLIIGVVLSDEQISGEGSVLPHIARVEINGIITDDRRQTELLEKLRRADQVKGVILAIDSPGGTTTGGEALYLAIRRLAKEKPVVASCGTLAASGAYIAAIATDHIVVLGNTLTGSIGVIFQWVDVTGLMDTIGVKVEEERSGELKARPNPFEPTDERTREFTRMMVEDAKDWFFGLVRERRKLDLSKVPGGTTGRVYSGRQAVEYKLADEIGDERAARLWLEKQKGLEQDMRVLDWRIHEESQSLFGSLLQGTAVALGVPASEIAGLLRRSAQPLQLDGLVSLWHASGE